MNSIMIYALSLLFYKSISAVEKHRLLFHLGLLLKVKVTRATRQPMAILGVSAIKVVY